MLILLLVLLPVFLYAFEVQLILLVELPHLLIGLFVLKSEWEKLVKVLTKSLDIFEVLKPVNLFLVLFLNLVFLVVFGDCNLVVLGLSIVLSLDMGVEGRVAEVGLPAGA